MLELLYNITLQRERSHIMIKDYKFKNIEKYLKKDVENGHEILDIFSSLTDAAIIFSPIIFGPQLLPLLELLDVKDKLFNLGHKVFDFISQKIEPNYLERMEQIEAAYALICYTAYFDSLNELIPRKTIKLLKKYYNDKIVLLDKNANVSNKKNNITTTTDICCEVFYADHITSFPQIEEQLLIVYKRVSNNLTKIIGEAEIFDNDEEGFEKLKTKIESLPQKAIKNYKSQYLKLSDEFSDFALFAQLQNFHGIHKSIENNKTAIDLLVDNTNKIDVGLRELSNIVNSISTNYSLIQVQDIVDDLNTKYHSIIEEPIITDKEIKSDNESLRVSFPKIKDAFIPQSYKCMIYQNKNIHLEDKIEWDELPIRNDLNKFFVEYLYSPDSIDYPLLILGHPGSGKSLLTKVLSAQLMSNSYTVIRIPLREVNAEAGFDVLVEEQIKKLTNRSLSTQGYGGFAKQFKEKPLTIILDGYDELLQAKGDIFSSYIERVKTFQQDQKGLKRPVRIIITSRITLIDKARIPINSTILRLMEFDSEQRETWINIWNSINSNYFLSSSIKPFALPESEVGTKSKVIELAKQPLLLLMLALYDSEANELAQTSNIKRTELYDNLLRRFVRRERSRYVDCFSDLSIKEQEIIIDEEMNRLGVAAIGMYNRRDVVIKSKQLENDLGLFDAHRNVFTKTNRGLQESDSVLGSFFFVHQSTAKDIEAHSEKTESAYEFLHNTFGEFLAADFILRKTINEVKDIYVDRKYKSSGLATKLSNPDAYNSSWFYCLMFVPLYSRPVVLEMLREHMPKALERMLSLNGNEISITYNDFIDNLTYLVKNQLNMILNTRSAPSVMQNGIVSDRDIPLIGYLSIYSLNLIILVCSLCRDGFIFDETKFKNSENKEKDSKPWDKLASLWKTWFSYDDLTGLSVILNARRKDETTVYIRCNDKFESIRYEQSIDILLCVSSTLADNLTTGLSGIQTERFSEIAHMDTRYILNMLSNENEYLYFSYLLKLVRREINGLTSKLSFYNKPCIDFKNVNHLINVLISDKRILNTKIDIYLEFFEIIEMCLHRDLIYISLKKELIKTISRIIDTFRRSFKKKRTPEIMCGIRVLRLLSNTNEIIQIDRGTDNFYVKDWMYNLEWDDSVERSMHYYASRYLSANRLSMYEFEGSDTDYRRAFISSVEMSSSLSPSEKAKMLELFTIPENYETYLKINPDLLTYAILVLINNTDMTKDNTPEYFDSFLSSSINLLSKIGIYLFGFDALTNLIKIAKSLNNRFAIESIKEIIIKQLFRNRNRNDSFLLILYRYPKFISNLLDLLPDFFIENETILYGDFYRWKKIPIENSKKILYFISCYRKITMLFDNRINNEIYDFLKFIKRSIEASDYTIDLNTITYKQIDDLIWFISISINKHQALNVIEKLQDYKKIFNDASTDYHIKITLSQLINK